MLGRLPPRRIDHETACRGGAVGALGGEGEGVGSPTRMGDGVKTT